MVEIGEFYRLVVEEVFFDDIFILDLKYRKSCYLKVWEKRFLGREKS